MLCSSCSMRPSVRCQTPGELVQCAALFCTYPAVAAKAALARVTFAKMSVALASGPDEQLRINVVMCDVQVDGQF